MKLWTWIKNKLSGKKRTTQIPQKSVIENPSQVLDGKTPTYGARIGNKVSLWATFYYSKVLEDTKNSSHVPLLDMSGKKLGPTLRPKDWCAAAMEGTVCIEGVVYNYAGKTGKSQTSCSYGPSEKVRWQVSKFPFGIGNRNNPLIPFYSLAVDQSIIPFGTLVFIPDAVGVKYKVNGVEFIHDGYFRADDVGGKIKGNHIDVFIGNVEGGLSGALKVNPFKFISSNPEITFDAYVVI